VDYALRTPSCQEEDRWTGLSRSARTGLAPSGKRSGIRQAPDRGAGRVHLLRMRCVCIASSRNPARSGRTASPSTSHPREIKTTATSTSSAGPGQEGHVRGPVHHYKRISHQQKARTGRGDRDVELPPPRPRTGRGEIAPRPPSPAVKVPCDRRRTRSPKQATWAKTSKHPLQAHTGRIATWRPPSAGSFTSTRFDKKPEWEKTRPSPRRLGGSVQQAFQESSKDAANVSAAGRPHHPNRIHQSYDHILLLRGAFVGLTA
jgi:hypothetical protein